ncbi:MAG: serine hydrolase [Proteobacteria bacterium]|nr:serine hydrolase [Pseudomonadota bacterium]
MRIHPINSGMTTRLALSIATSLALALPTTAAAASATPAQMTVEIARYFEQCHAVQVCNGSFLVVRQGKVLYRGALGNADATGKAQLGVDDQFDIGSVSKQFTAAAVVRLMERGKLSLDDQADKYLPELPYPDITLRQLLTHTSGTPDVFSVYQQLLVGGKVTAPILGNDAAHILAEHKMQLRFAPGSAFEYSNTGYLLLAQVVAHVSGSDYADFMQREFFTPLGMTHTRVRLPGNDAAIVPRAYGFMVRADGSRKPFDQIANFYPVGPGSIYSTTSDLERWAQALEQGKVMSKQDWALAQTPVRLNDGTTAPYGFGFNLTPSPLGQPRVAHGGDWRGFKADFTLLPRQGIHILMLTNNSQDDSVEAARDAVEAIIAGKPRPQLLEPAHWELYRRASSMNATELKAWLQQESARTPRRYDFPEQPLQQAAGELLRRKDGDKAIAVLEFNRDAHPQSLKALEALANAYLETGDRAAAIAQVRKMLEIRPDSKRAREKLAELQH